ncbi:MAG TPA: ComEC/Rec2 family competence protein [Cytophagaceae bacterium]
MIPWGAYPFIRYLVFLIIGILFYPWALAHKNITVTASVVIIIGFTISYTLLRIPSLAFRIKPLFGIASSLLLIVIGFISSYVNDHLNYSNHLIHNSKKLLTYSGKIISDGERKNNYTRYEFEIEKIYHTQWESCSGIIYLNINNKTSKFPTYGDRLLIKGKPDVIQPNQNPGQFNYKAYCAKKNIYHQHYISANDFTVTNHTVGNFIKAYSIKVKTFCDSLLKIKLGEGLEYSLATALVLGKKSDIDDEIKEAFSATGTMHIMAVSGLHVAMIYQLFALIFGIINRGNKGKKIFFLLIALTLLFYAFITGFSPSVTRAVIMFIIMALADATSKPKSSYNTLALTAFILLIYDPNCLYDIGFQLSFVAVAGILYIYPLLKNKFKFENAITSYIWDSACISIAAQIATFPISVYYFSQFPNYFLIANLVIIPISNAIIYTGLGIILSSVLLFFLPFISVILGWVTKLLLQLLASCLLFFESLPLPVTYFSKFTFSEIILIYLLIFFLLLYFLYTKKQILYLSIFTSFILIAHTLYQLVIISNQKELVVFSIKGQTAIAITKGFHSTIYADSTILNNPVYYKRHITPYLTNRSIASTTTKTIDFTTLNKIVWEGKRIAVSSNLNDIYQIRPDYLIITKNKNRIHQLPKRDGTIVIFDSSNKYIPDSTCFSTATGGAFIANL